MTQKSVKQGTSEGFDSCARHSILTQTGFKSSIFQPVWPWNLMDYPKKTKGHLFEPSDLEIWRMTFKNNRALLLSYLELFASFRSHWWIQTGVTVWKPLIWVNIDDYFEPCDLEIWCMTFINNRAPLLCHFKLCAAFHSHWWIQTGVTVRVKIRVRVKIVF